ncbi:MAG: mobilization protein [Gammaproteobacteria bacterium]|nr:mobilization protein [Gammaproteobacteria bacterium]
MSQIHFIGGEKGGVGKSVMARLLAQYCIDREIPFKAYDADLSHGAMLRYYSDYSEAVDINSFESADRIAEQTADTATCAIVDLAAQTAKPLSRWIVDSGLLELAMELELSLTFWHVMDDGKDSLVLLQQILDTYGESPKYVIVRNLGRGNDFNHLDLSPTISRAKAVGAHFFDLYALHTPTMRKIDHISASFWAAANNTNADLGPTLGILERQRVKTWLNKSYRELGRICTHLEV